MSPQYHLVLVSLILVILVFIYIIIYLKYFTKNKINYLFILLLISLLPVFSIFRQGTYESGDLSLHTMRAMSFYNILVHEHTLPRWAPELNLGYGDTYFEFIYLFPYIVISFFHFLGFSFLDSTKLLLASSYIASGIFMYLWAKKEFGDKGGFTAAIFYLFVPYHLLDMHFRVSIAESFAFLFLPLNYYLTKLFFEKRLNLTFFLYQAVAIALFILTHQPTFLISFPLIIIYGLITWYNLKKREYKTLIFYFLTLLLGILSTTFYWLPILFEGSYIQQVFSIKSVSFTPFQSTLFSSWRYGFLFQGHYGELSFIVGYTQWFVVLTSLFLLIKKVVPSKKLILLYFFLLSFAFYLFMMLSISDPLWHTIPLISNIQFTYRLLICVAFFTSTIAAITIISINNNKFLVVLCTITILSTILNWGNRGNLPEIKDNYLKHELLYGPTITGIAEPTAPRWVNSKGVYFINRPKAHLEIIDGKGQITDLVRKSTSHEYLLLANTPVKLKENTFFFPGWKVIVNDKPYSFTYTNKQYPGVILFELPKGVYKINVNFTDTFIRWLSKWVSSIIIIIIGIITLICYLPKINFYRNEALNKLASFFHNTFYPTKTKKR